MKIENIDFNTEAVKEMDFETFLNAYKSVFKNPQNVYEKLTGRKVEQPKEDPKKDLKTKK
jgi:hypothetical protein